jgi:hypothetical protein
MVAAAHDVGHGMPLRRAGHDASDRRSRASPVADSIGYAVPSGRCGLRTTLKILAAAFALTASACASAPSDGDLRALVAAEDTPWSAVREFRSVDRRTAGEGRYVVRVAYDVEYLMSSADAKVAAEDSMKASMKAKIDAGEPPDLGLVLNSTLGSVIALGLQSFEKGETRHFERELTVERWDSGWKLAKSDR